MQSQAFGYSLVCLFGVVFTLVTQGKFPTAIANLRHLPNLRSRPASTTGMIWIDHKYGGSKKNSEDFNTCGRSIKTGLIAVDIVSHWTWAATLLQSSNQAYQHGVSGPFW